MIHQAIVCHFLVLCSWTAIVGIWVDADASTWSEDARYLYIFGVHKLDEVLHDLVHAVLMEISVVAETEKIELEALALDHSHVRDIAYADLGEVRLACDRAE